MISSYVGENAEFERQYLAGELEVELTPQVCQKTHVKVYTFIFNTNKKNNDTAYENTFTNQIHSRILGLLNFKQTGYLICHLLPHRVLLQRGSGLGVLGFQPSSQPLAMAH